MSDQKEKVYKVVYECEASLHNAFYELTSFFLKAQRRMSGPDERFMLRAQYFATIRSILENYRLLSRKLIIYSRLYGLNSADRKMLADHHRKNAMKIKRRIAKLESQSEYWDLRQRKELQHLARIFIQALSEKNDLFKIL